MATISTASQGSVISSDYQTFLKMLTVQAQNQDPLNPIDSTEYASQLANFSQVEQQVKTNELLQSLIEAQGAQMAQMAGWIGKEVTVNGAISFSGKPVKLQMPDVAGQSADLVAYDLGGAELARQSVSADGGIFLWTGEDSEGGFLPAGQYNLKLESPNSPDAQIDPPRVLMSVTEIRRSASGLMLATSDGQLISIADVFSVKDAA